MRHHCIGGLLLAAALTFPLFASAGPTATNDKAAEKAARKRAQRAERARLARIDLAARAVALAEKREIGKARSFRRTKLQGDEVAARVARLESLTWQTDLDAAYAAARKANKPILWIHALGSLTGHL